VIVFVTDSGVFYGEQRLGGILTSGKNYPYDVVAKVPCIVRGPTFPAATVESTPAVLQDVTATILALFGAVATVELDGLDLRQLVGTPDPLRATLYERAADTEAPAGAGVVTATRKLTRWSGTTPADRYEAYDLDVDPAEHVSWAGVPGRAAELASLDGRLDALLSRTYAPLPG
jgi:arylsulfatase A-like enzyme